MIAVRPNEDLPITRLIEDHTDTNTYYVRAVIKNARTLITLATVDLTDNGGQYFSYNWKTPADPSDTGLYVDVLTSVYSDSGYTTKSPLYGDKLTQYKIEIDRARLGSGGGDSTDYRRMRKIIQEEIQKVPPVEAPKPEKVDFSGLFKKLDKAQETIEENKPPETDLSPVLDELAALRGEMAEMHEAKHAQSEEMKKEMREAMEEVQKKVGNLLKLASFFDQDTEAMKESIEELKKEFKQIQLVVMQPKDETVE